MAVTTTSVTGTVRDTSGTAISGATIEASNTQAYFYSDGSLITPYRVSTTSASNGTWSLTLVENVSSSTYTRVTVSFGDGNGGTIRRDYSIIVPASGPVTLASLATGQ
jgi:hypothetical protein